METKTIHPYAIIADFVNKYESLIEPSLKEGTLDATPVIADVCARRMIFEELKAPIKSEICAKYIIAIGYLGGLLSEEKIEGRTLDGVALSISRFVAEIDLALEDNPDYKSVRRKI